MKKLLQAFRAFLVYMVTPQPPLTPGICECGNARCCHVKGRNRCKIQYPGDNAWRFGYTCVCQTFILKKDDDEGANGPDLPSPSELERELEKWGRL